MLLPCPVNKSTAIKFLLAFPLFVLLPQLHAEDGWRTEADALIEKIRKQDFQVQVVDAQGHPAAGAQVGCHQLRPAFPFGAAMSGKLLGNPQYQEFFRSHFNWAVFQNEAKWYANEPARGEISYATADALLDWCEANDILVRGHNLFWSPEKWQPQWVAKLDTNELRQAVEERLESATGHFRGRLQQWDVNNEMLHGSFFRDRLGENIEPWMFQRAHELDPDVKLFVNDYNILSADKDFKNVQTDEYVAEIRKLLAQGALIQGIGIQGHIWNEDILAHPEVIKQRLDKIAALGLPVWITEFDVADADEKSSADKLELVYRTAYSHSSVAGIMTWIPWAGDSWRGTNAGLAHVNWTLSAAGQRFESLMREWSTQTNGEADANGNFAFRGFPGDYEITVSVPGGESVTQKIVLDATLGKTNFIFSLGQSSGTTERVIAADWNQIKGPTTQMFHECIGAGRANEGLRADWQRQLQLCQDEIDFKQIRFHGLLSDDMGVYSEDRSGQPHHNWQYIDQLYDALLAMKIRPFVELSFMPSALASGSKKIFWWQANVTPPKSYEKWDGLIQDLVAHWTERYGADEVAKWNFEIWNEPNYPGFWGPRNPQRAREEYFELYDHTATAVKSVNTNYLVGGPAGAGPDWVKSFLNFCAASNAPLDFISYHGYGLGGGPSGLDADGNSFFYLSDDLLAPAHNAISQRAVIDASAKPNLPVHITEWSTSYSPRDPVHDAYFSAPYILEQFKNTEHGIASFSYWTFTDIFEENGPPMTPFHGGFGLLNFSGIKKPAYFAFQFMNQLGKSELKNADAHSWVCRDQNGGAQILLWDLTHPTGGKIADQVYFRQPHPAADKGTVEIKLTSIPPGKYELQLLRVGYHHNDAYTAYLEMGAPAQLTRAQEQILRYASRGEPESGRQIEINSSGEFTDTVSLHENEVIFLKVVPLRVQ
jgi:xylan 1,4-beta-xylosidase